MSQLFFTVFQLSALARSNSEWMTRYWRRFDYDISYFTIILFFRIPLYMRVRSRRCWLLQRDGIHGNAHHWSTLLNHACNYEMKFKKLHSIAHDSRSRPKILLPFPHDSRNMEIIMSRVRSQEYRDLTSLFILSLLACRTEGGKVIAASTAASQSSFTFRGRKRKVMWRTEIKCKVEREKEEGSEKEIWSKSS